MYGLQRKTKLNGSSESVYRMLKTSENIDDLKKELKRLVITGIPLGELYLIKQIHTTIEIDIQTHEDLERGNKNESK